MGEVKTQLAEEAARGAANAAAAPVIAIAEGSGKKASPPTTGAVQRSDVTKLTLAPGQGAEVKAVMAKDAKIAFDWSVEGGHVNFDTHADAPGGDYHSYGKGKQSTGEKGELVAAFDGKHGWFWSNRSGAPVTITLRTEGAYTDIRRVA